jgi:ABC-type multidrug transport system ATPase subunit
MEFAAGLFESREPRAEWDRLVEGFGLASHLEKALGEMSSGTAKKVVIASAFASGAPVLLFDEPTNELDSASVDFFLSLVRAAEEKVVVVATHRIEQLEAHACGIVRLDLRDQPGGER